MSSMIRPGALLLALLFACTPDTKNNTAPDSTSIAQTSRWRPDAAIKELFTTHCAACHGVDQSGGRAPSLFNQTLLDQHTTASIQEIVLNGIPDAGMPPFKGILSDAEILQLLTFMRNEADRYTEKPVFVPSPDNFEVHSSKQSFRMEVLASGLEVPWGLAFLPDGRMLVTERSGNLRIIEDGQLLPGPVMGTPEVQVGQDGGLFDVAVHPNYQENGWIYLSYAQTLPGYVPPEQPETTPSGRPILPPSMTVIARGKLNENDQWIESQELFRAPAELYTTPGVHYGTRFVFDRDHHLYYSIGDRGKMENAQDLSTPLGKIHRINDDGSVPDDNPFVGVAGALPTIWSYGHRNPQGLSFDPHTGLLWSSEHGPMGGDEINIIEPGNNYGWGVISMGLQPGITRYQAPGMEQPIVHYTPTLAPSGISFNSGDRYPGWSHSLFVAGLAGQQLRRLEIKDREVVEQEVLFDQFGRTRTAVFGPDGLLYVLLQTPTGSGTGLRLAAPTPGMVVRLIPLTPS